MSILITHTMLSQQLEINQTPSMLAPLLPLYTHGTTQVKQPPLQAVHAERVELRGGRRRGPHEVIPTKHQHLPTIFVIHGSVAIDSCNINIIITIAGTRIVPCVHTRSVKLTPFIIQPAIAEWQSQLMHTYTWINPRDTEFTCTCTCTSVQCRYLRTIWPKRSYAELHPGAVHETVLKHTRRKVPARLHPTNHNHPVTSEHGRVASHRPRRLLEPVKGAHGKEWSWMTLYMFNPPRSKWGGGGWSIKEAPPMTFCETSINAYNSWPP